MPRTGTTIEDAASSIAQLDVWTGPAPNAARGDDVHGAHASPDPTSNGASRDALGVPPARPQARRAPRRSVRRSVRKIRYTDAEWTIVVERAYECRKAPARYVREVSLGAVPKAKRSAANAALIRELGRIGNVIVGLSQAIQERPENADTAPIGASLDAALRELLDAVRRLD